MLTRRQTLRALGAAGLAAPVVTACGDRTSDRALADGSDLKLLKADVDRSAGNPAAVGEVVGAMNSFTADLWKQIAATDDNVAFSPFSIAVALAMTANGAAGRTAQQMLDVLHSGSLATYNAGMAALTQELEAFAGPVMLPDHSSDSIALASADQLFGDRATTWQQPFLTVLAKQYGAGMRDVDFRGAPDHARVLINAWTSDRTHGRIPEILPKGIVDVTTRLVLVNALYFKAPWETQFQKALTSAAAFHRADGARVSVPMMRGDAKGSAVYLPGAHFTGARLPYAGGRLAMTVALPNADEDSALAELLAPHALTAKGEPAVAVTMPRWHYRVPTDLRDTLIALGMTDAFDDRLADFSPMTTDADLYIAFVLHQTFVAVDEAGTEAAAATAVGMDESAAIESHTLVLDRPFLFVVHDVAHGTPLFVGRVADPT